MRYLVAILVLFISFDDAHGTIPDKVCVGTKAISQFVNGSKIQTYDKTLDVYKFYEGHLYRSWPGREEYKYNNVIQLPTVRNNQLLSGYMRFVFTDDNNGFVVHADHLQWTITYFKCRKIY